jgi:hypothetical protein
MSKRVGGGVVLAGVVLLLAGCSGTQGEGPRPPARKAANPKDVTLYVKGMAKDLNLF